MLKKSSIVLNIVIKLSHMTITFDFFQVDCSSSYQEGSVSVLNDKIRLIKT